MSGGDIGKLLFIQSPLPTITVCPCRRITAANPAAAELLRKDDLYQHCGKFVCGTNCLKSLTIEDLNFHLEGSNLSWETVLERSRDKALRAVRDVPGFSKDEVYANFTRMAKPRAPIQTRHDSPVKDSFSDGEERPSSPDDWHAPVAESIRAKVLISPFQHQNMTQYILVFTEHTITQHAPNQMVQVDRHYEEDWMSRCRNAIFDSIPMLGYLTDPQGKVTYLNKLTSRLANGVTSRVVKAGDLWDEDFTRKLTYEELPSIQILRSRKELEPFRYGQIDPETGMKYLVRAWGNCLFDVRSGEFLGSVVFAEVLGLYDELVEKKKVDRLKSFETICDTMPHYVWTADEKGYGEWFSSQWLEYTGLKPEECQGWGWKQTIHPDDVDRFSKAFHEAHALGINYEIEARCRSASGSYLWMLKRGSPIKDQNGKVLLWTGTNTDIHSTVVARLRAKHERDQIVRAMQHAQVNVWAVNKDPKKLTMIEGSVIRTHLAHQAEGKQVPNSQQQIGLETWQSIADPSDLDKAVESVMRGEVERAEIELKWNDRWHKVWVIPDFADENGVTASDGSVMGVIGCSIDMTDEKLRYALERDNKQLEEEKHLAKEQSRMKSKFLANMSHEIRTPVAGVIGLANLLLDSNLDHDQRDHTEAIQMSAQTLLMIVNDILDFSKVESGKLTLEEIEFNLATLVTNLWKVMHYSAQQKSIDFTCVLNIPSDLNVVGDPGRIRQVLTNLISNAIKFTGEGTVKLTATVVEGKHNQRIIFMVEDSGIGIKKEVLANLFRPFQQGDSSTARLFGGSGLGLSISRSLAQLMKGHIELDSTAGVGTVATFSIPLVATSPVMLSEGPRCLMPLSRAKSLQPANAEPAYRRPSVVARRTKSYNDRRMETLSPEVRKASEALKQQLPPQERARTHILLAEDNAVNRLIAIRSVEKLGFTVSAVWNGKEALEYLTTAPSETHKKADIVLMDCQMPVMDGYCATHKLRNEEPYKGNKALKGLPVVAMTASAIQGDREKCFDAGMSDYLSKPVEIGNLEAMLVKWALSRRLEEQKNGIEEVRRGSVLDYFGGVEYSMCS
ncbi:Histidine kinase-, DNA gyrase B-, and HSP90-like ATPase-like protein 7 [Elsinoe fawcettii]|nr:Histidine kinase-, DNA gyrase B-, and HSP90-like ATPase-like protein 7 [Elsinoe fawcettii]